MTSGPMASEAKHLKLGKKFYSDITTKRSTHIESCEPTSFLFEFNIIYKNVKLPIVLQKVINLPFNVQVSIYAGITYFLQQIQN